MLDIKFIREHKEEVKTNCANRQARVDIDRLLAVDDERRKLITQIDEARAGRNQQSKSKPDAAAITRLKEVGESIQKKEAQLRQVEESLEQLLMAVPNLTHPDVKISNDENDNPVQEQFGKPTKFNFTPKDHLALAQRLDLIDLERAAKVSGAKFYYLKNELALMELALVQYALNIIVKHGYLPLITPDLAKTEIVAKLGFNPRGDSSQVYQVAETDLCLIGTAEITLGGYHAAETFAADELPKRYTALSHCFRTEAGSYSKFSKGLFRVHQFSKVEMFVYCRPEESNKLLKELVEIQKEIWRGLDVPFRVTDHSSADLGNPAYRTFDLEAWLPGKPAASGSVGDWAEVTSASNCTDYQTRGLNINFKNESGDKQLAHTLNATGIAVSRAVIALLENHQQADGSIDIPKALRPYLGGLKIIKNYR